MNARPLDSLDGALLVDKPAGPTSHDVVDAVRRQFRLKKVGHAGTLDPNATGLLILLLGRGTKLSERLMATDKTYEGTIRLGISTDSYDADGQVTATGPVPEVSLEELNQLASGFVGDLMQTPPMVSAVKKEGVPLYKLARKGIEVPREPRLIHVYQFHFDHYQPPDATFRVKCTKGTYVRSLAHELGGKLGCGAHLKNLRRTISGELRVENAVPFEDLIRFDESGLVRHVIPMIQLATRLAAAAP
jgi:tRNA pseudouridine55 synthase